MINEQFLSFVWQFQYFNKGELYTTHNEKVVIIKPGLLNKNEGPDFLEATISINNVQLHGSIELHTKSSHWHKHQHNSNKHYNNVILHVVWENDEPNSYLPTLELQGRVAKAIVDRYAYFMISPSIPCQAKEFPKLSEIAWLAWKERLLFERLQRKTTIIYQQLQQTNNHWEEVFWWKLASNFGVTVNAHIFEQIAKSISITILAKQKNQLLQIEALLLGQANLLHIESNDTYIAKLQQEYALLKAKYKLQPIAITPKFLRMRPANFPTIRLAQLAKLIYQSKHLFTVVKNMEPIKDVQQLLEVEASSFFNTHYKLENIAANNTVKSLGANMVNNIIINTIVPMVFAYALWHKNEALQNKCIQWLQQLPNENNSITKQWKKLGQKNNNAFDSQAFIELTNNYCTPKKCLQCAVGNKILQQKL
jgi:hypothetical protein